MENKEFILDQTTIRKLLDTYRLTIPDFQRSFVWKKNKKVQLLDSLFKGFPIGAITLYEENKGYYIIDGLQRINTLKQYLSYPSQIISFTDFFKKIADDFERYIEQYHLSKVKGKLKKSIKEWYEGLDGLYKYEKVSILYNKIKNLEGIKEVIEKDIQVVEELRDILQRKIEIAHDDIALIIYTGDKEDLPELFKNINTGSVALSQYEILQSVWTDYYLDENIVNSEYEAFLEELELVQDNYEITAVKENGRFDIFKNIIGLNHRICCMKDSDILFRFPAYKERNVKESTEKSRIKYYDNDSIGFEIYSTLLCYSSNKIVKAVDKLYHKKHDEHKRNYFIKELNEIIIDAIKEAMECISSQQERVIESKYHSIYIITGLVFAKYFIDASELTIISHEYNHRIYELCLDFKKHNAENWFKDENRQMKFFNDRIEELLRLIE